MATHVTAVDFIEAYVEKNKEINGHHKHLKFLAADVMELELPPKRSVSIFLPTDEHALISKHATHTCGNNNSAVQFENI